MKQQNHLPCPLDDCSSSDAYTLYEDGHGFCFSCNRPHFPENEKSMTKESYSVQYAPWRGITRKTMERYGVQAHVDDNGNPVEFMFEYPDKSIQVRKTDSKQFYFRNNTPGPKLFGTNLFTPGCARRVVLTEGVIDALSAFQIMGGAYPVLAVANAQGAVKACSENIEYLRSFKEVVLAFDSDDPGQEAVRKVASLFPITQVKFVEMTRFKDANEYLTNGAATEFGIAVDNARRIGRDDIVNSFNDIQNILESEQQKKSVSLPFPRLQEMTYGLRKGEVVLFTAQEGIGKTEVLRKISYHLLKTEEDLTLGCMFLEENKERTIKGMAGYELGAPVHLPTSGFSIEQIMEGYKNAVTDENRFHIFTHFGSDDPDDILHAIRFLVSALGCDYILFDHITMVVTGSMEDQTKKLDYLSTQLKQLAEELDFGLILVSHINDNGQTRGSRNIGKIADCRIQLSRDLTHESATVRNTTHMMVEKNRFGAETGPADRLEFNPETFQLDVQIADGMPPAVPEDPTERGL